MAVIIDGYNLLHASGILGGGVGPGGLERSRQALLNFLVASLDANVRKQTVVVFDASDAPPGLPRTLKHDEITVRFASDHEDADSLIEELILRDSAPRHLTVVSSDHRLQRAARRRRARFVDSRTWYDQIVRERSERRAAEERLPLKPTSPPTADEVDFWLRKFEEDEKSAESKPHDPFPPGYGEDLLEEED